MIAKRCTLAIWEHHEVLRYPPLLTVDDLWVLVDLGNPLLAGSPIFMEGLVLAVLRPWRPNDRSFQGRVFLRPKYDVPWAPGKDRYPSVRYSKPRFLSGKSLNLSKKEFSSYLLVLLLDSPYVL